MNFKESAALHVWRTQVSSTEIPAGGFGTVTAYSYSTLRCRASAGKPGRYSDTTGVLLHAEIQEMIENYDVTPVIRKESGVRAVSWEDHWPSFDDAATWRMKANQAWGQCILGVIVSVISQDDGDETNLKALTSAIGRRRGDLWGLKLNPLGEEMNDGSIELRRWSGCATRCSLGFKEVKLDGSDVAITDQTYYSLVGHPSSAAPQTSQHPVALDADLEP